MLDPELLERITARRAALDELEEQPAKQLAEVRAAGPLVARQVGDALGIDVSVRGKLEPLRGRQVGLVDAAGCANYPMAGSPPACDLICRLRQRGASVTWAPLAAVGVF
ncbi:hypothetical protein ACFYPK_24380 [Streptomyces halstedii]|uniref:hypothetical protein n=1 Tax=Streptomyces halstedii TaxID=1944 RepID=UPI00345FC012